MQFRKFHRRKKENKELKFKQAQGVGSTMLTCEKLRREKTRG